MRGYIARKCIAYAAGIFAAAGVVRAMKSAWGGGEDAGNDGGCQDGRDSHETDRNGAVEEGGK